MKKMFYIENCDGVVVCWVPCALFFASRCCRCQRRWTARGRPGANFFYFFLLDQESESESSVLCGCLASLSVFPFVGCVRVVLASSPACTLAHKKPACTGSDSRLVCRSEGTAYGLRVPQITTTIQLQPLATQKRQHSCLLLGELRVL